MSTLEVRELGVSRGRRPLVRGATFSVDGGEVVAVVGASGAGKSTMLAAVAGFIRPDHGEVVVEGVRLTRLRAGRLARVRRDLIGLVLQHGNLVPSMTAMENVQVALDLRGVKGSRERAIGALRQVGLGHVLDAHPGSLSGGEAQRVAIARAIATRSRAILLDEPTAALDVGTRDEVVDALTMLRDEGSAILMVTHDLDLAAASARVGHLRDGALSFLPTSTGAALRQLLGPKA